MTDEIKIQAQPDTNPNRFRFLVDREVYPEQVIFTTAALAQEGSALAKRLFELDGVTRVEFNGRLCYVTQDGNAEWTTLARQVGATVREHLQSGAPVLVDGFVPVVPPDEVLRRKVQTVVDAEINPGIAMHGGFIEILDVKERTVFVRMGGGCQGCGSADATLKQGVERMIRDGVPEVEAVLDTTDHAAGKNPFFQPH